MREIVSEKEFLHVMHDELARLGLTEKKSFSFRFRGKTNDSIADAEKVAS
jgi:Ca2+-binding EF-hand superfamily protein